MNTLIPIEAPAELMLSNESAHPDNGQAFDVLVAGTLQTIAPSSARIYQKTYATWQTWCGERQLDPLVLYAAQVTAFLTDQIVSHSTRQRQLAALRKLARVLAVADYDNTARRAAYESLLLIRTPHEGATQHEHITRALSPGQAARVLDVWGGTKPVHQRNAALVALLFLTGLRRSEAAALRWSDIDLEEGVLQVRHGKGDTARTVAIAGHTALAALAVWRTTQARLGGEREFTFCALTKGDKLTIDKPMTDHGVYFVIKQTQKASGVTFSPHDARRTFITEALTTGAMLADVQAQAGHKQESTTLRYAKPVDARQRRQRLRLRYGDE